MATGSKNAKAAPAEPATIAASSGQAVRGASVLIILQVASRAVTFIANQLLVRFLTAQLLGISTQLEVYYLSVLFFARESLRVAIQRHGSGSETKGKDSASSRTTQAAINLAYLTILIGLLVATLLGWLYLSSISPTTTSSTPYLTESLYLYALASLIELLSEPAFIVMQVRLVFSARAAAEATATLLRTVTTLSAAVWASRSGHAIGVLPFALGQLAYGCGLLAVYAWHGSALASAEGFSLLPRRLVGGAREYILGCFYRPTLTLAASMTAQSLVKHVLTQGDTLLVSVLSTPTAQGVYALANNYGGLAARLLFQPVEESSRNYFSRLLAGSRPAGGKGEKDATGKEAAVRASRDLSALLKAYVLLSLVITTLGPTASPPLLALVTGPRWASSGAGATLAAYMWYIPLLAFNGVAEAFVASVASEAEVHTQSAWMLVFSLIFAGAGYVCLRVLDMGAIGLVLANCVNMLCRIVWAITFIKRWFGARGVDFELAELRPGAIGMGAAVVASQMVKTVVGDEDVAAAGATAQIKTLVKIAGVAVPFVIAFAYSERRFLAQCFATARGKRATS